MLKTRNRPLQPQCSTRVYHCEPLERRVLMAAGDLDPSFSGDGRVTTSFPGYSYAQGSDVAVQADGKIVVAGFASNSKDTDFGVARYLPDGTLDPSFSGGRVTVSPTRLLFGQNDRYESATAVALRPDGRIVVGGNVSSPTSSYFTVVQLMPDGSPDASFGLNGATYDDSVVYDLENLKIDAQGRIVFAGSKNRTMLVGRLTPDGRYDPTFNGSGIAVIDFPGATQSFGNALVLRPDGEIVVGGYATVPGGYDFALARLLPNGTLDEDFGFIGRVLTAVGQRLSGSQRLDVLESLALAPDGRIWAAGYEDNSYIPIHARYLPDGSLDPTFGQNGLGVGTFGTQNVIRDIVLQPDGKAVEVGNYRSDDVFRFRVEDGRLDPSFAGGGMTEIDFPSVSQSLAYAAALQPDGGIVVAGAALLSNVSAFAVFRLQGDSPALQATEAGALSSAWSAGFRQHLAAEGKGSADIGYTLAADPSGPPLPWTNLDTLAVRFNVPFSAAAVAGGLSVSVEGRSLAVQSVAASPFDDKVMLIRLAAPLAAGRVRLRINSVQDAAGRPFERTIPLLPGDVDQSGGAVNASDLVRVRNGVGRTASNPGTGSAAYRTLIDLNGDGVVNASDLVLVRNRIGSSLSTNLVVNGGFEEPNFADPFRILQPGDSTLTGWTVDGAGIVHNGSYWQASEGKQSVELNLNASGGISLSVPTQPGRQYRISFDMAGQPNAGPELKRMQVFWEGSLVKTELFSTHSTTLSDMGWSHREIVVTATGTSAALRFFGSEPANVDGGPALDNVSVTPVATSTVRVATASTVPPLFGAIEIEPTSKHREWINELM